MAEARELLGKSLELLRQCGARYELALTRMTAGQANCFDSETRDGHLRQAKALFVEMEVPKRFAQVDALMAGTTSTVAIPNANGSRRSNIAVPQVVTRNSRMLQLLTEAKIFAQADVTILITGETGTGKDLLASHIHFLSPRAEGKFSNENMSRFPQELIDTELFGYEKGSHSLAEKNKPGLIALASGGTFCLNEIADLPLTMQTKLLQVIEDGTVRPVGGGEPRLVDVRFIAMTNRDLAAMVKLGTFREDLFYRLEGFHLHLPPLRDRMDDLPELLRFFLNQFGFGQVDLDEATATVRDSGADSYDWPGNVRQLRRIVERAVLLTPSRSLSELSYSLSAVLCDISPDDPDSAQRAIFTTVLRKNGGNQIQAARELGMSATTFRRRLADFGIL